MAYLALYRKYRPTDFNGLIGQEHVVKTLVNQITLDRLGHAYLFTGTRGTGKTSAAKIFAKAINCLNPKNGSPCEECAACKALSDPSNIDVVELDAASNNGVNEIRELREKVQFPPVSCRYKVYIVDEVHMLTGAAFNALLKTLEEPPKHAVFILATTEVHKIPATILSRCMRFDFRLISTEKISELISKVYDELGKKYDKEAVFAIAKAGEGSIRDALSIADIALSYNDGKLTYNDVMEILGSSDSDTIVDFVRSIIASDTGNVLNTIDRLCALGKSIGVLIKDVTALIRDLLIVQTCENANKILALPLIKFDSYKELASTTDEQRLLRILEIFSEAETQLKYSNHPRVIFETASVKAAKPQADYDVEALMSRIKILESKLDGADIQKIVKEKPEKVLGNEDNIPEPSSNVKMRIEDVSLKDLKGKILFNLRKNGSEMLWNILQQSEIQVKGDVLTILCSNNADQELLEKEHSRNKIIEALEDFVDYKLVIQTSLEEKKLDEVDDAAERVKKIFGNDIVVIK